ncbi:MAG TPA: 50S ribosomal protein L10 [Candidatus Acetothermia bacterium]|nr:50S ribosomal protein L10 [Candidatus Bipolaricaulota bacterium]HDI11075.1 50S ribosomal protein L10 [Candidatus Acetothermia bacterium]
MPRPEKVAQVQNLKEKFSKAQGLVLVEYQGIPAPEMVRLREFLKERGLEFRVIKNTLARIAALEVGLEGLAEYLRGPNAIVVGYDDPAVPFRAVRELRKDFPQLRVKVGLFEGETIPPQEADKIAELPSREELLARLAGAVAGPIRGLAVALSGIIRKLAVVLAEVQKRKEASS